VIAAVGTGIPVAPPLTVGELIGFGVVLYDVSGRARAVDNQLTLDALRYGLYSGRGQGTIDVALAGDGLSAHARLTGENVRIEEFIGAYGIRGGTMTGLLRYDLDMRYGSVRLGADSRMIWCRRAVPSRSSCWTASSPTPTPIRAAW
jgi:hypothetical protein